MGQGAMKESLLVMKFGGTSVGSPEALENAWRVVDSAKREWRDVLVVVSAASGVTNLLLDSASRAAAGVKPILEAAPPNLLERHVVLADRMIGNEARKAALISEFDALAGAFENLLRAIQVLGEATPRALDAVASLGERFSVRLFAAILKDRGLTSVALEATELILTDDRFQSAHPNMLETVQQTQERVLPHLKKGEVPVVTGFLGATAEGVTTTLGRGGSDFSAAILAVALQAAEVWIWTDVDGVMTADPRIVSDARTIPLLSYREVGELAYFGARVLHPKTIRPVIEAGIRLKVLNTLNPDHPGTELTARRQRDDRKTIQAVTAIRGQKLVTVEGRGMLGVPGVAARTFGAVASTGTSVILISQASSEQSICLAVPAESADQVVGALQRAFVIEIQNRDIDRIWASEEAVIVTVVGVGMQHTPGVAGQIFSALGKENVNVIAIAQGSSEVAISLMVKADEMERAVRAIHSLIE
jgi:bifunctional aspartokinase / homoserine dehydrogenase 1